MRPLLTSLLVPNVRGVLEVYANNPACLDIARFRVIVSFISPHDQVDSRRIPICATAFRWRQLDTARPNLDISFQIDQRCVMTRAIFFDDAVGRKVDPRLVWTDGHIVKAGRYRILG